MSEEEIIDRIKNLIYILVEERKYGKVDIEQIKIQEAIQGLLDLYNKEKDKNASLEKEIKLMKSININDNYVSKDKIRELQHKIVHKLCMENWGEKTKIGLNFQINILGKLLKENNKCK